MPHFDSDEPAFEGLAESLRLGNGYTDRRIGFDVVEASGPLCLVRLGRDAREHGRILDVYAAAHQDVVDDHALSVRPPLFPAVLAASTALLGSDVEVIAIPFGASKRDAIREAVARPRPGWRRAQLAVALPPLLASLAICLLAFLVHRGSALAAALGALAVATAPLEVWCAHRVTADSLTAALVGGATVLLAAAHRREGRLPLVALAGALGGLSVLAKPSGALLAPAYAVVEAVLVLRGEPWRRAAARAALFAAVLAAVGLWWAALQLVVPGGSVVTALGYGGVGYTAEAARGAWPSFVRSRPFWIVPASTAALSPLLALGAAGLLARAREREALPLLAVGALFLVTTMVWPAKENRYLLPAYVAFAGGLAWVVERLLERARGRGTRAALATCFVLAMVPSAIYAREAALSGAFELTPIGPTYGGDR